MNEMAPVAAYPANEVINSNERRGFSRRKILGILGVGLAAALAGGGTAVYYVNREVPQVATEDDRGRDTFMPAESAPALEPVNFAEYTNGRHTTEAEYKKSLEIYGDNPQEVFTKTANALSSLVALGEYDNPNDPRILLHKEQLFVIHQAALVGPYSTPDPSNPWKVDKALERDELFRKIQEKSVATEHIRQTLVGTNTVKFGDQLKIMASQAELTRNFVDDNSKPLSIDYQVPIYYDRIASEEQEAAIAMHPEFALHAELDEPTLYTMTITRQAAGKPWYLEALFKGKY